MRTNQRTLKDGKKFMQVLDTKIWKQLQKLAKSRGVTVQEYLRVIVIPDHLRRTTHFKADFRTNWNHSRSAKKGWIKRRKNQSSSKPDDNQAIPIIQTEPLETDRVKAI